MRIVFLAVLTLAVPALAQVSPDEANARLAQRQTQERAAATQPARITNAQLQALEKQIVQLRAEVKRLLADNASLKSRLDKAIAAATPATKPTAQKMQWSQRVDKAIQDGTILIGMTEDEARQAAKHDLIYSPVKGLDPVAAMNQLSPRDQLISESRGEDAGGTTSIVWSNWRASVTVIMREGKVVSYRENK